MRRNACLLALMLAVSGCAAEARETRALGMEPDGGVTHPQAQYLPFPDAPRINLVLNDSAESGTALARLIALTTDGNQIARIGGDSTTPFGEVQRVIGVGEDIGVFDPYEMGLHLISRSGEAVATLGRAGTGPGEFRRPQRQPRSLSPRRCSAPIPPAASSMR